MELQHGDLIGTTATLLAGIDRALDPNGDGDLSDRADVILAPVAEPFAAFGASPETIAAEGAERAGAVLVAAAGNDGPTGARFGTVASPGASPGWLAVGAADGRVALPRVGVTFTTDGVDSEVGEHAAGRRADARERRARCRSCCPPGRPTRTRRAPRPTSSPGRTRTTSSSTARASSRARPCSCRATAR